MSLFSFLNFCHILSFFLLTIWFLEYCHVLSFFYKLSFCVSITNIFSRPSVAGKVLQSPQSLIQSVTDPFLQNHQNIITHKPENLESWNFERMVTPHNLTHAACHVPCFPCHMSQATCHIKNKKNKSCIRETSNLITDEDRSTNVFCFV